MDNKEAITTLNIYRSHLIYLCGQNPTESEPIQVYEAAISALEKLTPRNAQEELPEHPGDYLVQFANADRLSVFHWTGDKWISQSNSWMWDKDSVKAWWTLPEVVRCDD